MSLCVCDNDDDKKEEEEKYIENSDNDNGENVWFDVTLDWKKHQIYREYANF